MTDLDCGECDFEADSQDDLLKHQVSHHGKAAKKPKK